MAEIYKIFLLIFFFFIIIEYLFFSGSKFSQMQPMQYLFFVGWKVSIMILSLFSFQVKFF